MASGLSILRFFRDAEALLRELVRRDPPDLTAKLVKLANEIAAQAAALKAELIAEGTIPDDSGPPPSAH